MRTIRITGKGLLRLKPDTTRITMTLTGLDPDYGEALQRSSEGTETLRELLTGLGFAPSDLKTLQFHVNTEYESYQDERGNYLQRFAGYRFQHVMKVEFASDNERLGRILYALSGCSAQPEFRISYTIRDPESAKTALLGKAVADAKAKADVLARASGVALGEIQTIDYARSELGFESAPMDGVMLAKSRMSAADGCWDLNIEPDAIEVSDTVTVIWEIG